MNDFYSKSDIARAAGINRTSVERAIANGKINKPSVNVGLKMPKYTIAEADEIIGVLTNWLDNSEHMTLEELSKISGLTVAQINYKRLHGVIPHPNKLPGQKKFYLRSDLPKLLEKLNESYVSIFELSKISGLGEPLVHFRIQSGVISPPTFIEEGKCKPKYLRSEIPEILEKLSKPHIRKDKEELPGLLSRQEIAEELNVAPITIGHHIKQGHIPTPTKTMKGWSGYYYSQAEAAQVRAFFDTNTSGNRSCIRVSLASKDRLQKMSLEQSKSVATIVEELLKGAE